MKRGVAALIKLAKDTNGDAVVEATILFPIMIMVFAALVLLAAYLPTRAALQKATQYAATAIATERSDTWIYYNDSSMSYSWEDDKSKLKNVYVTLFSKDNDIEGEGEGIVTEIESRSLSSKAGTLRVHSYIVNRVIYKEVVVEACREFSVPVNMAIIGLPKDMPIPIMVTSTAVIQNGDEFVRNMDIAVDFVEFIFEKFELTDISKSISSFGDQVSKLLGW